MNGDALLPTGSFCKPKSQIADRPLASSRLTLFSWLFFFLLNVLSCESDISV